MVEDSRKLLQTVSVLPGLAPEQLQYTVVVVQCTGMQQVVVLDTSVVAGRFGAADIQLEVAHRLPVLEAGVDIPQGPVGLVHNIREDIAQRVGRSGTQSSREVSHWDRCYTSTGFVGR